MSILEPNMNLILPTIGVDSGLIWEQSMNANSLLIGQHNHSVGEGVQINPSGIYINADLPFNNFNSISHRSVRFYPQTSPLSTPADIGAIYAAGPNGNLYYNDLLGNQIQITLAGAVFATSSGISSGTATASFVGGTLVVESAAGTPGNIQAGSILLGNNTFGSNFLTLSPPAVLATNYSIILPVLPIQTNVLTLDPSGNMASITYNQVGQNMTSAGTDAIAASMSSVGANTIANNRTRSVAGSVAVGGIAQSASCGAFSTASTSYVAVTNLNVIITTAGRPVALQLVADANPTVGSLSVTTGASSGAINISITNNTNGATFQYLLRTPSTGLLAIPAGAVSAIDTTVSGAPSTYNYSVYLLQTSLSTATLNNVRLVAYEL